MRANNSQSYMSTSGRHKKANCLFFSSSYMYNSNWDFEDDYGRVSWGDDNDNWAWY